MKYAMLLSGGISKRYNYMRYACDLAFAYQVFSRIWSGVPFWTQILYADGRAIDYLGQKLDTIAATLVNVRTQLEKIKRETKIEDEVYIVVSNHGYGGAGNSGINLWEKEMLTLNELVAHINQLQCKKYLVLGQCYGGDVFSLDIHNALVLTANEAGKYSYARIFPEMINLCGVNYQYYYDEFLYHFLSGLNGAYPSGQCLNGRNTPCTTIEEAYEYAKVNDNWNPSHALYADICKRTGEYGASEIPQLRCYA